MKKNILILTTGGTISAVKSESGLVPSDINNEFKKILNDNESNITIESLLTLDSSNMQPEEWKILAKTVFDNLNKYDGIIITHGTDTMAYSSSMLSFMVQNPNIPIVFTGSQLPIFHELTDAIDNLRCALKMAKSGVKGIFLAFNRRIFLGCRVVKARTSSFDCFETINFKAIAKVSASGLIIREEMLKYNNEKPKLVLDIDTNVFLLKLTPNTDPKIIDILINSGISGIVIEAYGIGGIPYERRNFAEAIKKAIDKGIPVVVCSQCLYERSNFNIYEVGTKVILNGAIEALDMTTEASVSKLMYALGQTKDLNQIKEIFTTPIAQEIVPNIK